VKPPSSGRAQKQQCSHGTQRGTPVPWRP
jgi:hypothetical protein